MIASGLRKFRLRILFHRGGGAGSPLHAAVNPVTIKPGLDSLSGFVPSAAAARPDRGRGKPYQLCTYEESEVNVRVRSRRAQCIAYQQTRAGIPRSTSLGDG